MVLLGSGFYGNGDGEVQVGVNLFEPHARTSFSEDPTVDPNGADFRLKASAAQALGAGYPMGFLVDGAISSWSGSPDLGAVQQHVRPLVNPSFVGAF